MLSNLPSTTEETAIFNGNIACDGPRLDNPVARPDIKPFARHAVRLPASIKALAVTEGNGSKICVVKDLSTSGARVEVPGAPIESKSFVLFVPEFKIALKCTRIWQSGKSIGIQFESGRPDVSSLMDDCLKMDA